MIVKPICCAPLSAGLEVARDVLDHHDRVVDDEAGRDRERHQRQVVQAVAHQIHRAEGADDRDRHREARDQRGARAAQEHEDHEDDEHDREAELELDVAHGRADAESAVGEDLHLERGRQRRLQVGQLRLDRVDGRDHIRAGLAVHVEDDRGPRVLPRAELHVLGARDDVRDVAQAHRRAVLIGDDQVLVVVDGQQLVVRVDRVRARRPVEAALRAVCVGVGDRGAQLVEAQADRGELASVRLDPHRGPLAARKRHEPDAADLRDLLREPRFDEIAHVGERHAVGGHREREHRRVCGVDLRVHGRRGQVRRQQRAARVDRGLYFLLGDVEREVQAELQRHDRGAGGARR